MSKIPTSFKGVIKKAEQESPEGLPKTYNDTKIVILPRDPLWIYAYWEVSGDTISKLTVQLSKNVYEKSRWTLRVYDVTDVLFNGKNAHRSFDIAISLDSGSWYINCGQSNRVWCIDLGLVTPDGKFIVVARSAAIPTPRYGISPIIDEKWGILKAEFEKILELSGEKRIGKSSFDVATLMKEKWEEIISMPSSGMVGSLRGHKAIKGKKDFWLKADTELIVYGSTERDARLKIQGKPVTLKSDGSFSIRMSLPDGNFNIPIEAVSKDGSMKRKISFKVSRKSSKR